MGEKAKEEKVEQPPEVDENLQQEMDDLTNETVSVEDEDAAADALERGEEPAEDAEDVEEDSVEDEAEDETEEEESDELDSEEVMDEVVAEGDPDPRDDEIKALKEAVAGFQAQLAQLTQPTQPTEPEPPPPGPFDDIALPDIDALKDIDMDEITSDPQAFGDLMRDVQRSTIQHAGGLIMQAVLQRVPQVVQSQQAQAAQFRQIHTEFYGKHKDLVPFKRVVQESVYELQRENPNISLQEVLDKSATLARKKLNLQPPKASAKSGKTRTVKQTTQKPAMPTQPKRTGARAKPKSSKSMSEMDQMTRDL